MNSYLPFSMHTGMIQSAANGRQWQEFPQAEMNEDYLEELLSAYEPITLVEMKAATLMDRIETKYLMRMENLTRAISYLSHSYRVLIVKGRRISHYQTLYFDTEDFTAFRDHHDGVRSRYKIRSREYVGTNTTFLEVKRKNNLNRTRKIRIRTPDVVSELDEEYRDFIRVHCPYDVRLLEPKLWNDFLRFTLVSKHRVERLTLDINLQFGNDKVQDALPGVAIAEVKQEDFSMQSDFIHQMRIQGIRPTRFSKYCIGVARICNDVKRNRFKPILLMVDKLMKDAGIYEYTH